jgi:transposase
MLCRCFRASQFKLSEPIFCPPLSPPHTPKLTSIPPPPSPMHHFTPAEKHSILLHVRSRRSGQSVDDIAALHGVDGGRRTINNWLNRWNGTAASLQHKQGAGRPRLLSRGQVDRLIRAPIRNKNRSHTAIHYPQLLPSVQQKTGKQIALRTLQNYGARDAHVKLKHTKKRTASESEYTHTSHTELEVVLHEYELIQCLFVCVVFLLSVC